MRQAEGPKVLNNMGVVMVSLSLLCVYAVTVIFFRFSCGCQGISQRPPLTQPFLNWCCE